MWFAVRRRTTTDNNGRRRPLSHRGWRTTSCGVWTGLKVRISLRRGNCVLVGVRMSVSLIDTVRRYTRWNTRRVAARRRRRLKNAAATTRENDGRPGLLSSGRAVDRTTNTCRRREMKRRYSFIVLAAASAAAVIVAYHGHPRRRRYRHTSLREWVGRVQPSTSPSTPCRSFRRRIFPVNHLHWHQQRNFWKNWDKTCKKHKDITLGHKPQPLYQSVRRWAKCVSP